MASETLCLVQRTQEIALVKIKIPALVQLLSDKHRVTTPVVSESCRAPCTTVIHTLVRPVKIGAQVPTGVASHGKMLKAMFQETHQLKTTIDGIRTQRKSSFQYPMKVQRTETHRNKQMI